MYNRTSPPHRRDVIHRSHMGQISRSRANTLRHDGPLAFQASLGTRHEGVAAINSCALFVYRWLIAGRADLDQDLPQTLPPSS